MKSRTKEIKRKNIVIKLIKCCKRDTANNQSNKRKNINNRKDIAIIQQVSIKTTKKTLNTFIITQVSSKMPTLTHCSPKICNLILTRKIFQHLITHIYQTH